MTQFSEVLKTNFALKMLIAAGSALSFFALYYRSLLDSLPKGARILLDSQTLTSEVSDFTSSLVVSFAFMKIISFSLVDKEIVLRLLAARTESHLYRMAVYNFLVLYRALRGSDIYFALRFFVFLCIFLMLHLGFFLGAAIFIFFIALFVLILAPVVLSVSLKERSPREIRKRRKSDAGSDHFERASTWAHFLDVNIRAIRHFNKQPRRVVFSSLLAVFSIWLVLIPGILGNVVIYTRTKNTAIIEMNQKGSLAVAPIFSTSSGIVVAEGFYFWGQKAVNVKFVPFDAIISTKFKM